MLQMTQLSGFGGGGVNTSPQFLYDQIVALGLTTSLNLVLDAGDSRCYDGSSQTWTDATGNGNNFYRGTTSGSDATDPSFSGSIGSWADSTYFGFNGSQYFTETSAQTYAANWHKNNGVCSFAAILYLPTRTAISRIFSTKGNANADAGVAFGVDASGFPYVRHSTTTAATELVVALTAINADGWNFLGFSYDEAATTIRFQINGTAATATPTASTDTDAHGTPITIGASTTATQPFINGDKLAALAVWSLALSAPNLADLYAQAKNRIPSIP